MPRQRVQVNRDWSLDGFSVRIARENHDGTYSSMEAATFVTIPRGGICQESFNFTQEGAQEMMNELWNLGFRPTDATGSTGHLRAVENHATNLNQIIDKLFVELAHR